MSTQVEVPRDKDTQSYIQEMKQRGINLEPSKNGEPARLSVITRPHVLKNGDVQNALLKAIKEASDGKAKPDQVEALCKSASVLIELAKLQIQVQEKALEVGWLGEVIEK